MEIWKDIEGYQGLYQISNLGNIKSLHNYRKGNILKPRLKKGFIWRFKSEVMSNVDNI